MSAPKDLIKREEWLEKFRVVNTGKHLTEEQKQKCRVARLGKHLTEEAKQKDREAHLGYCPSEATLVKMRKPRSEEAKQHMRKPHKPMSEESRRNIKHLMGKDHPGWKGGISKCSGKCTLDEYNKLFEKQNGVCAICGQLETRKSRRRDGSVDRLSIDHNHSTGKIRGLLCTRCNRGLGSFMDNIEFLLKAIRYLKEEF